MRKLKYKRSAALLLGLLLGFSPCMRNIEPAMVSYAYTARAATVNATNLNVRSGPGTSYSVVAKLSRGVSVTVINEANASDGALWYQIRFAGSNGAEVTGYVSNSYLKFPAKYSSDADFEAYLNAQGFPESYKPGLRELHAQYPNWVFTAQKINLDWNTVIQNEAVLPRSLVHTSSISSWKSTADGAYDWSGSSWPGFDGASWVAASEDIIRYYMDPRNFLDDTYIFQFLLHTYDASVHTREGVASQIKGSFLENSVPGASGSPGGTGSGDNTDTGIGPGSSTGPGGSSPGSSNGGSSPGSSNGGNSSGSTPGIGPGGSTPGTGSGSDNFGGPQGAGNGGNSNGGGGNGNISLEAPGASISKKDTNVLTTNIGPGAAPGSSSSSPSGSPQTSGSNSYVDIIMNAGVQSGVNPYVLAAMIIQEQGKGTSPLISGNYAGYEGYYNYFNVGAFQSGSSSAIQSGLLYASQSGSYGRPWNSPEKSIIGGAMYYGDSYVKAGQDTFYLKKFNVQGSNLYKHQYMTNIQGAASEAAIYSKAYSAELKNTALEFKIPVYNNMPDQACSKPVVDGSPNNKLSGLSVNGFTLTPTFNRDMQSYDLIVDTSVSAVTVNANAIHSKAKITGAGYNQLQVGNNDIKISVQAENGSVRDYIIHVVRQNNGPLDNGSVYPGDTGGSPGSGNTGNSPGGTNTGGSQGGIGPGGTSGPGAGSTPSGGGNSQTPSAGTPGGSNVTIFPQGSSSSGDVTGTVTVPGGSFPPVSSPKENQSQENSGTGNPAGTEGGKESGLGDIDGDGKITIADLVRLKRHILGLEALSGQNQLAADMNGDKTLDVKDVVLLQRSILGLS